MISLSPVETAMAFGAPILETSDSNNDATAILEEVGNKEVRYGVAVNSAAEKLGDEAKPMNQLLLGDSDHIRTVRTGETFTR